MALGAAVKGKIVVAPYYPVARQLKTPLAAEFGAVALLEAARGLSKTGMTLDRTVRFVCFGVEETGLVGDWSYTHEHADELDDVVLMLNNSRSSATGSQMSGSGPVP